MSMMEQRTITIVEIRINGARKFITSPGIVSYEIVNFGTLYHFVNLRLGKTDSSPFWSSSRSSRLRYSYARSTDMGLRLPVQCWY